MVLKSLFGSTVDEEEEQDVYLRKCNIRKSKRQSEKSRKIAIQVNEQLSFDRVPSPVPLPIIKPGSAAKSPSRKDKSQYSSPYFAPKSRTNSTDDVYPLPSPPPRSPSFGSPAAALSKTLALSLSLFSPGGFTISGQRKTPMRYSPETLLPAAGIARAHSADSTGSWGEIVDIGGAHSPQRSPRLDTGDRLTPHATPEQDADYYQDGENNAHLRDSNRVKQFLFHRDRNRARKAQLLYPSGTYGNSCEFSPDLDDSHRSPDARFRADRKIGSPVNPYGGSNNKDRTHRRNGIQNHNQSHSHSHHKIRRQSEDYNNLKVDEDTDRRSGSIGSSADTTPSHHHTPHSNHRHNRTDHHSHRKLSFHRVDSPHTPYAVPSESPLYGTAGPGQSLIPTHAQGPEESSPFAQNSPYYRALTLGARGSPTVPTAPAHLHFPKNTRSNSVGSVGSVGSAGSSQSSDQSVVHAPAPAPTSAQVEGTHQDSFIRRRRDSVTSQDSTHSADQDQSVEIYDTLFPALPGGPLVKKHSNLSTTMVAAVSPSTAAAAVAAVTAPASSSASGSVSGPASAPAIIVAPVLEVPVVVAPLVTKHSAPQLCRLFHAALVHAGRSANNMPPEDVAVHGITGMHSSTSASTPSSTVHGLGATKGVDTAVRYRAWDDADSSDEEDCASDSSFDVSVDSTTNRSVHAVQQQVQKLLEIDATCGNLIQKCDYIYDTIKTRTPYQFDEQYVQSLVEPFLEKDHILPMVRRPSGMPGMNGKGAPPVAAPADCALSIQQLLSVYVQPRMLYQLVQMLQYEDTRFESARLPVLYVLYKGGAGGIDNSNNNNSKNSSSGGSADRKREKKNISNIPKVDAAPSVRIKIAQAIEHAASERQHRCTQLLATATATEMDVNFISKAGFAELVASSAQTAYSTTSSNVVTPNPVAAVATHCDLTAIIHSENERASYKTKDSEVTMIELMKFIIAHEITELLLLQSQAQEALDAQWSVETKSASPSIRTSKSEARQAAAASTARHTESRLALLSLVRGYSSLFRCYTYKLGAHYAGSGDSVEQPVLLEYLMQTLDGLLAWAKVLTNNNTTVSGGGLFNRPSSVAASKTVLEEVCECILRSTYKHWTSGLNYAQDVAYLLQSEIVLTLYTPVTVSSSSSSSNSCISYSAAFASSNRTDTNTRATLPPLYLRNQSTATTTTTATTTAPTVPSTYTNTCIGQKVLTKMLSRVCSQHVKVATQAMQSLQSPVLMVRYFLPRMTTAMVSYIFGTEVGRVTFMSGPGWENGRREECLNMLVDRLRECRNVYLNFSTQLQISSTQLLDTTLELLQVIEDAE